MSEKFTPRGTTSAGYYFNELTKKSIPMDAEEEFEVATKAADGDLEARDKLVNANLRFVASVAKMYTNDSDTYLDVVSAGNYGMIKAAERFDPSRGFKFISYAVWHVRAEIIKYLSQNSRMIRLPGNRYNYLSKVKDLMKTMTSQLDREPTVEELVEVLRADENEKSLVQGITVEELNFMLSTDQRHSSLDAPLGYDGEGGTLQDVYVESEGDFTEKIEKGPDNPMFVELFENLSPLEIDCVKRFHGIGSKLGISESMKSIADDYEVSSEQIRQRIFKATRRMKFNARRKGIKRTDIF